nr:hypothetical protein [Tanacetum cinerariifolium]
KVIHTAKTDMEKLMVEIESFGLIVDELDMETGSSNRLQLKQVDLSCIHALNKPHLHEIHVVPNKVIHTAKTDMEKLMVEIESFGLIVDELDMETGSSNRLQLKQVDLSCIHALNKPHLHEIHVVPSKHEADQYSLCANPEPV